MSTQMCDSACESGIAALGNSDILQSPNELGHTPFGS